MAADSAWRSVLAAALDERGTEYLATETAAALARESKLVRGDRDLQELAYRSSKAHLAIVADIVRGNAQLSDFEPTAATSAHALELARRNAPITELAMGYRVAQRIAWRFGVTHLHEALHDPSQVGPAVEAWTTAVFATGEVMMGRAFEHFARERDRWVRSADAVRRATLEDVLAARVTDIGAASARLRYELRREHVGFAVWGDVDDAVLESTATAIAGSSALVIAMRPGLVVGWCSPGTLSPRPGTPAWVATGMPGSGIAGFRATHDQALHARRVAQLTGAAPGQFAYADCALLAVLTSDSEQARAFAERELGPLAEPAQERLATTVRAVLQALGSPRQAAKQLGLHENTVAKRIRSAEELLGRPITERTSETLAALLILPACRGEV